MYLLKENQINLSVQPRPTRKTDTSLLPVNAEPCTAKMEALYWKVVHMAMTITPPARPIQPQVPPALQEDEDLLQGLMIHLRWVSHSHHPMWEKATVNWAQTNRVRKPGRKVRRPILNSSDPEPRAPHRQHRILQDKIFLFSTPRSSRAGPRRPLLADRHHALAKHPLLALRRLVPDLRKP